jgi:hypothetical protein
MKKVISSLVFICLGFLLFNSCDNKKESTPVQPELPPYESMAIDFSKLTTAQKSADIITTDTTQLNFAKAALTVFFWNATITITLAVPVTAFYASFQQDPTYLGDGTWQWSYSVPGFGNTYKARLTGKVSDESIKWEMYISKEGINAYDEFKWFEGTSNYDGSGGQWILYNSYELQEQMLQIDWEKTDSVIGNIKYTYVQESNNGDAKQLTSGSYLQYGLKDAALNAFYNVEYNQRDRNANDMLNVDIEWSLTEYNGRIKAAHYFDGDDSWHCWDSLGYDAVCE